MSNLTIRFYSNCLRRYTTFKMYLPCDIRQDWADRNEILGKQHQNAFLAARFYRRRRKLGA